jgi:hypothetical protein
MPNETESANSGGLRWLFIGNEEGFAAMSLFFANSWKSPGGVYTPGRIAVCSCMMAVSE